MTARPVTQSLRRELERQESGEVLLVFLTITHADLVETIRVVSDVKDYIYGGQTFVGFPFDIELLSDSEGFPRAQLAIQNVDQKIGETLRQVSGPPRLRIELLSASDFDLLADPRVPLDSPVPSYVASDLFLVDVEVDVLSIAGTIQSWNYTQELWPGLRATQNRCPALFR